MSDPLVRAELCRALQAALRRKPTGLVTVRMSLADAGTLVVAAASAVAAGVRVAPEHGLAELFMPRASAEALVERLSEAPGDEISPKGGQDTPSGASRAEASGE